MPDLRYGVVGRGRWGKRIARILADRDRKVRVFELSRRVKEEGKQSYKDRVLDCFQREIEGLDVLWLAVPPSDQDILVRCALECGRHIVIEKPWICDADTTMALIAQAELQGIQIAVHYQYCYIERLGAIRSAVKPMGMGAVFSGEFTISKRDRLAIPAKYNLGSHLLAIKCLYFPMARIGSISTGYDGIDRRAVHIQSEVNDFTVDILNNNELIVQRFIDQLEHALHANHKFPINLDLALKVKIELDKLS